MSDPIRVPDPTTGADQPESPAGEAAATHFLRQEAERRGLRLTTSDRALVVAGHGGALVLVPGPGGERVALCTDAPVPKAEFRAAVRASLDAIVAVGQRPPD